MSEPIELQARIIVKDGEFVFTNFSGEEFLIETVKNHLAKLLGEEKTLAFVKDMLNRSAQDYLVRSNIFGGRRKK